MKECLPERTAPVSYSWTSGIDELLHGRIILRLSDVSEDALRDNIKRLEIRLDAFAIDPAEFVAENPTPTRDLISTAVVHQEEEPQVVVNAFEKDGQSGNHVYVIWNVEAFLSEFPSVLGWMS